MPQTDPVPAQAALAVTWYVPQGERIAHAFPDQSGFARSLCAAKVRWDVRAELATEGDPNCPDCAAIVTRAENPTARDARVEAAL